jgi:hypothetical protein
MMHYKAAAAAAAATAAADDDDDALPAFDCCSWCEFTLQHSQQPTHLP